MNEFDGIQYIAMEFVDGLPLSDLLYEATFRPNLRMEPREKSICRALIRSLRS